MFSYFTELNRKRPPLDDLDLVTFTTSALVHAGDDRSVMEGLGALPFIAGSAAGIAGGKPVAVGPSAIGMRENPYGEKPMDNPGNIRQAMNYNDPRQRGLLGSRLEPRLFRPLLRWRGGGGDARRPRRSVRRAARARWTGRSHGTTRPAASIPSSTSCAGSPG